MQRRQIFRDPYDAKIIIIGAYSVFGDIHRFIFQSVQAMIHRFGEKFFKIKFFRYHAKFFKRKSPTVQIFFTRIDYIARIKIDRPEIACILYLFIVYSADSGNDKFARPHRVEKELMIDDVIPFLRRHVEFISLALTELLHKSMRRSDRRARILTDKMIGPAVKYRTIEFAR